MCRRAEESKHSHSILRVDSIVSQTTVWCIVFGVTVALEAVTNLWFAMHCAFCRVDHPEVGYLVGLLGVGTTVEHCDDYCRRI